MNIWPLSLRDSIVLFVLPPNRRLDDIYGGYMTASLGRQVINFNKSTGFANNFTFSFKELSQVLWMHFCFDIYVQRIISNVIVIFSWFKGFGGTQRNVSASVCCGIVQRTQFCKVSHAACHMGNVRHDHLSATQVQSARVAKLCPPPNSDSSHSSHNSRRGCRSVLVLQNVDGAKIRKPCSNRFQWVYREFKKMRYCEFWEQRAHYQGRIWLCWMFTWAEISTIFFRVCSNEYRFTIPFTHEMIHSLYTCLNFLEGIHDELRPRDSILQNRVLRKTGTLIVISRTGDSNQSNEFTPVTS